MDTLVFVLKKLVSRLLFPVGLVLVLGLAGVVLWLRKPRRRLGPALVIAAGLILWALATPLVAGCLLAPLERMAGPYAQPQELARLGVRQVVVLAGSQRGAGLSPADRCGDSTTLRVLEGVRLWKGIKGARLVLSGGSFAQGPSAAQAMAALAVQVGVPPGAIRQETTSWDTDDQARILADKLGREPFALVTSASHLPRALRIFRAYGLNPYPAPADFQGAGSGQGSFLALLPQAQGLAVSQRALYEYLGLILWELKSLAGLAPLPPPAPPRTEPG